MTSSGAELSDRYQIEHCDLCIVGAGIAGLNALFAASRYLSPSDKVILIDKNQTYGGMWLETYDYVHLHQPYRMFTAGNIAWQLNRNRGYLASKREVMEHFAHCVEALRAQVQLVEHYDYVFETYEEVLVDDAYQAQIYCRSNVETSKPLLVKAKKCVKAFGFNVEKNAPLEFSSTNVRSLSPNDDDFLDGVKASSDAPIYIVGGGKTGMDTARVLLSRFPHKEINLVVGGGTIFANRNKNFPDGLRRWCGGTTTLGYFLGLCLRYDGENAEEIFQSFKRDRAVHLAGTGEGYMYGILSEEENAFIEEGVTDVITEYVSDVIDLEGKTKIVFRSGNTREIPSGSCVINCTGYIMRDASPYESFLSDNGTTVSIQATSAFHFLSTFSAYFLVHLFYLDQLEKMPFYELNAHAMRIKDKVALPFVAMSLVLYNTILMLDAVPSKVMLECGLDFDRWFPWYRRLFVILKLRLNRRTYLRHFKLTLDRVHEKYGVECGVLRRR